MRLNLLSEDVAVGAIPIGIMCTVLETRNEKSEWFGLRLLAGSSLITRLDRKNGLATQLLSIRVMISEFPIVLAEYRRNAGRVNRRERWEPSQI